MVKLFYKRFMNQKHVYREVEGNRLFKKAEIPTAEIVWFGPVVDCRAQAVILDYIYPSENLGTILQAAGDTVKCRAYLEKLMVLLARLHGAGLRHNDLHLDNFLVKHDDLYALDGAAIEEIFQDAPLKKNDSLKNLAVIFAQLGLRDRKLYQDLVACYCAARNFKDMNQLPKILEEQIRVRQKVRISRYLKKIYRESTETVCRKTFFEYTLCKRVHYTPAMEDFLKDPDVAFDVPGTLLLNSGNSTSVVRFKVDDQDIVVKRYNVKNFVHGLRLAFKKSRGNRSWFWAHLLLEYGIRTPRPIAMKEIRWGPFRNRAYLICEYIEGMSAEDYFKGVLSKDKKETSQNILHLFDRLADLRVSHGDMKASNIMIHDGRALLIDFDSMAVQKNKIRFVRARRKDIKQFKKNWTNLPEIAHLFGSLV
ncbi:MAG: lipopolysaccharide kinase InaA family protein [Desulfobacteraceae bacterium]